MSHKVLVTYASRTGSAAGVAEAIGKTLAESGAQVEVKPIEAVKDLSPYDAIVAGSAIRGGQWLPEAVEFVQTNRAALKQKTFATFTVCMTMAMKNAQARDGVVKWLEPVHALVRPVSEGYFAGILDIRKVPTLRDRLMFRISVLMGVWKEGDNRDWSAIRDWAKDLSAKLRGATHPIATG
ncbi:MAG: flavodoxin domain-containing protein [Anaerolineae bacterium]|nr:flavodoxin domain-containing protein [Anaerolineae bacterium]